MIKKHQQILLSVVLIFYVVLFSNYMLIEECLLLFIIPILASIILALLIYGMIFIFISLKLKWFINKSIYLCLILQIGIFITVYKIASPKYYTKSELVADIDFAIERMENIHPDLYNRIPKDKFINIMDSLKDDIPEKISDLYAFKTFCKMGALFKDGHTSGGFSYFSNISAFFRKLPPYKFKVRNDRIWIIKNHSYRNTIPIGAEILEMNGKPVKKCIEEASLLNSWETIPFRNALLKYNIFWGLWNDFRDFKIKYKTTGGDIATVMSRGGIFTFIKSMQDMSIGKTGSDLGCSKLALF